MAWKNSCFKALRVNMKIMKFVEWLKKVWSQRPKADPYFYIANNMAMEGYTDLEIAVEIDAMKKAHGDPPYEVKKDIKEDKVVKM
jgi:hypothetical protein